MNINIVESGILQINDARIIYRNFSGAPSDFNREGDRNFSLIIPTQEMADMLIEEGWNVKIKPPREEGDLPFMVLPIKVKFNERGPKVYLQSGRNHRKLSEDSIGLLDKIAIKSIDMDIRPYDWTMFEGTANEKSGRSAYLQSMWVEQEVDRFMERMAEEEFPTE